ncbi:MAG TPA: PEP-CTERM sorting domain-containing protein [Bryobacteraceae bacterium]|jgi:hypothetical protein
MRILLFILLAFAATCQANDITVTFNPATLSGTPGSVLDFFGTLTNDDLFSLDIDSDSFTLAGFPTGVDDSPFLNNAPSSLGAGATTLPFEFFTVTIPLNQAPGTYNGSFTVIGGPSSNGGGQDNLGAGTFAVTVSGVPEPGTWLMLLAAGLLVPARRYFPNWRSMKSR